MMISVEHDNDGELQSALDNLGADGPEEDALGSRLRYACFGNDRMMEEGGREGMGMEMNV